MNEKRLIRNSQIVKFALIERIRDGGLREVEVFDSLSNERDTKQLVQLIRAATQRTRIYFSIIRSHSRSTDD